MDKKTMFLWLREALLCAGLEAGRFRDGVGDIAIVKINNKQSKGAVKRPYIHKEKLDPNRVIWIKHAPLKFSSNTRQGDIEREFEEEVKKIIVLFEDHVNSSSNICTDFGVRFQVWNTLSSSVRQSIVESVEVNIRSSRSGDSLSQVRGTWNHWMSFVKTQPMSSTTDVKKIVANPSPVLASEFVLWKKQQCAWSAPIAHKNMLWLSGVVGFNWPVEFPGKKGAVKRPPPGQYAEKEGFHPEALWIWETLASSGDMLAFGCLLCVYGSLRASDGQKLKIDWEASNQRFIVGEVYASKASNQRFKIKIRLCSVSNQRWWAPFKEILLGDDSRDFLFTNKKGNWASTQEINRLIHAQLIQAGMDPDLVDHFGAHSLRRVIAAWATMVGHSLLQLLVLGLWKGGSSSDVAMPLRYNDSRLTEACDITTKSIGIMKLWDYMTKDKFSTWNQEDFSLFFKRKLLLKLLLEQSSFEEQGEFFAVWNDSCFGF